MKRTTMAALGLVIGLTAGCRDMGLDGNIPLEEARDRPPSDLVAAVMRPAEALAERLIVDGRLWVPSGVPLTIEASELRAIGSAEGRTVYARGWDQAPYDALFVRRSTPATVPGGGPPTGASPVGGGATGEEWVELRPVLGRTGPVPAGAAGGSGGAASGHGGH